MNPGIFYLYEYNNMQKIRNVGFLKLTRYYHSCTLQLNARGIPVTYADTIKLCAFYLENDTVGATVLAEVPCTNHMVSARLNFAECQFPDGHTLNTMDGFFLPLSNGRILAAAVPGILVDTKKLLSVFENPPAAETLSENTKDVSEAEETVPNDEEPSDMKSDQETAVPKVPDTKPEHEEPAVSEMQDTKPDGENSVLQMQDITPDCEEAVPQAQDFTLCVKEDAPKTQEFTSNTVEISTDTPGAVSEEPEHDKTISESPFAMQFEEDSLPSITDAEPNQEDIVPSTGSVAPDGNTTTPDSNNTIPADTDSCDTIPTDTDSCDTIPTDTDSSNTNPTGTDFCSENDNSETAPDTPQQTVRKIQRSDMSALPRCYWHLANNSFLLHGYHNYSHLLLVEKDGRYWLGVPGIYDSREARAARLFGFPQFTDSYNDQLQLSDDEKSSQGTFGYWCCYLK